MIGQEKRTYGNRITTKTASPYLFENYYFKTNQKDPLSSAALFMVSWNS